MFLKGSQVLKEALSNEYSILSGIFNPSALHEILYHMINHKEIEGKCLLLFKDEDEMDIFLQHFELPYLELRHFSNDPYSGLEPSPYISAERMRFLYHAQWVDSPFKIFLSYSEAFFIKSLSASSLQKISSTFEFADNFFEDPHKSLNEIGYILSHFVEKPGQYSIKGGIVDIFSPAHKNPIRIELFGNDIESLRFFNPKTQRNLQETETFTLIPASETLLSDTAKSSLISHISSLSEESSWKRESLHKIRNGQAFSEQEFFIPLFWEEQSSPLDYFNPQKDHIFYFDESDIKNTWENKVQTFEDEYSNLKNKKYLPLKYLYEQNINFQKHFLSQVNICSVLVSDLEDFTQEKERKELHYSTSNIQATLSSLKKKSAHWSDFNNEVKSLIQNWLTTKNTIVICCKSDNAILRAQSLLKGLNFSFQKIASIEKAKNENISLCKKDILQSIKFNEEQVILLKYEELFGKEQPTSKSTKAKKDDYFEKLEALKIGDLEIDDLVVHIQHGVGRYKGLITLELQGFPEECIEIHYEGKDKLFLPVHKIGQIRKYSSGQSSRSLDKLGGSYWQRTKVKVKARLKDIANDLIELYAKRKIMERPPLETSHDDFKLFQSQFPYQETADQITAVENLVEDFEKSYPMDRLICGDVGFGKTEVAMRAAFLAMNEGKQVAVLAPTTVLALQHLQSFKKRFKPWPFEIRGLNRFISRAESKATVEELKKGKVDLVIGTHRILSQDVAFKNLGLLVVDEEQKFGVKQKEKLKNLKASVDVISLSATPIPRTLNMGFLGVRDLSLITTPPKNRLPIKTYVSHYSPNVVSQAIESELKRGGQVYLVHNRVQSIYSLYEELKESLPHVRIALGHGQMKENELESVMVRFFNREVDVLLATTIIESGVDVSSANTIIINNAQNFGLSQLYQLRGRVGRSEHRAYCYLLIPPNHELEKDQKERLKILQDHTALGSGLQIAHYDLELRGAGNMLGESQSGHAEVIGYDFYIELLEEAIAEAQGKEVEKDFEPEIHMPLPALIPSSYMPDIKSRLYYYRRLNKIEKDSQLDDLEDELKEQFGAIPEEVVGLFFLSATKNLCKKLGVQDLKVSSNIVSLKFIAKPHINHGRLFDLVKKKKSRYTLSPDQRILIQSQNTTWPELYEEVQFLVKELLP